MTNLPLMFSKKWDSFHPTDINYLFVFAEAKRRGWVNPAKTYSSPQAVGADQEGWANPRPLPNSLRKVKALNVGCLPSTVRDAVQDIAERLSCPVDYVAASLLVCAGMALKPLGDVGRGLWLEWSLTSKKSQDD